MYDHLGVLFIIALYYVATFQFFFCFLKLKLKNYNHVKQCCCCFVTRLLKGYVYYNKAASEQCLCNLIKSCNRLFTRLCFVQTCTKIKVVFSSSVRHLLVITYVACHYKCVNYQGCIYIV